jgi:hypothetical protein
LALEVREQTFVAAQENLNKALATAGQKFQIEFAIPRELSLKSLLSSLESSIGQAGRRLGDVRVAAEQDAGTRIAAASKDLNRALAQDTLTRIGNDSNASEQKVRNEQEVNRRIAELQFEQFPRSRREQAQFKLEISRTDIANFESELDRIDKQLKEVLSVEVVLAIDQEAKEAAQRELEQAFRETQNKLNAARSESRFLSDDIDRRRFRAGLSPSERSEFDRQERREEREATRRDTRLAAFDRQETFRQLRDDNVLFPDFDVLGREQAINRLGFAGGAATAEQRRRDELDRFRETGRIDIGEAKQVRINASSIVIEGLTQAGILSSTPSADPFGE